MYLSTPDFFFAISANFLTAVIVYFQVCFLFNSELGSLGIPFRSQTMFTPLKSFDLTLRISFLIILSLL